MNTGRTVTASGNQSIDGILTGSAWQSLNVTFSFPTASSQYGPDQATYGNNAPFNGFGTLTAAAQAVTRSVLAEFAQVSQLVITEVTESSTVHGDVRSAYSTEPGAPPGSPNGAFAFTPGLDIGGDIFYDNRQVLYSTPVLGDESFLTILHEVGHAFGLAHGH